MYNIGTYALILPNWWIISSTKTSHICQTHPNNSEFYIIRVFMYLKIKIWYFKNVLKVCELVGWGASTAHCACEQILYYGTNPWNVFTLILYSFIDLYEISDSVRSDSCIQLYLYGPNSRVCLKRHNWPENIKISNGEGFFSTPFSIQ